MIAKSLLIISLAVVCVAPTLAFAKSAGVNSNVWSPGILKGPLVTCTGTGTGKVPYACESLCDLVSTFANVVYFFIGVVIWIVTPILFAWSGLLFMLSQGNPGRQGDAKKMITGTVIGILIVLCAYLIVFTFIKIVGISGVGGFGTPACPL